LSEGSPLLKERVMLGVGVRGVGPCPGFKSLSPSTRDLQCALSAVASSFRSMRSCNDLPHVPRPLF